MAEKAAWVLKLGAWVGVLGDWLAVPALFVLLFAGAWRFFLVGLAALLLRRLVFYLLSFPSTVLVAQTLKAAERNRNRRALWVAFIVVISLSVGMLVWGINMYLFCTMLEMLAARHFFVVIMGVLVCFMAGTGITVSYGIRGEEFFNLCLYNLARAGLYVLFVVNLLSWKGVMWGFGVLIVLLAVVEAIMVSVSVLGTESSKTGPIYNTNHSTSDPESPLNMPSSAFFRLSTNWQHITYRKSK